MYKLTTKNGNIVFTTIEDLMIYVINKQDKLFIDGAFIKICELEDVNV